MLLCKVRVMDFAKKFSGKTDLIEDGFEKILGFVRFDAFLSFRGLRSLDWVMELCR